DIIWRVFHRIKESKEASYWLRILREIGVPNNEKLNDLIQESLELKNIFGSIMKNIHFRKDV
ncbi:MAG TPA: four helix bundle protein, partial [Candidatus Moranbacteria bacterium]|nr:four helix bundle protein [Candidatus Moranbacteria bacterium]